MRLTLLQGIVSVLNLSLFSVVVADPENSYIKFAYESSASKDLLSYDSLSDLCKLEKKHLDAAVDRLCPVMSLPYYVSLLSSKEDCDQLSREDVTAAVGLLDRCVPFYKNGTLTSATTHSKPEVPQQCTSGGLVFNLLHYVLDGNLYRHQRRGKLLYTVSYWKRPHFFDGTRFYKNHFEGKEIRQGLVQLTGLGLPDQLDVKYALFAQYVLEDLVFFAIAGGAILFLMFLYLQSFVLILATVVNIIFSFAIAYFIYFSVCGLKFYPFINLLAGLVLVAVGADDVFIFYDCWLQFKKDTSLEMHQIIAQTLNHAALAIFVTSLTTASAFFSNMVSCITSIQCFAIFAGIAVLVNFVLMVTWTPSIIILCELITRKLQKACCLPTVNMLQTINEKLDQLSYAIFGRLFPALVEKAWFLWLIVFFALGVVSCVVVFVKPRLTLPSTADFQVFPSSNVLEHWDLEVAARIDGLREHAMRTEEEVSLDFLWGLEARDTGDKLDPDDEPDTITLDKSFDFYSEDSQLWFSEFCHNLLNASYTDPRYTESSICIFDAYSMILKQYCTYTSHSGGGQGRDLISTACCGDLAIPFNTSQLKVCFPLMSYYYSTRRHTMASSNPLRNRRLLGVPIFDRNSSVVALHFHVKSNFTMSFSYSLMRKRYTSIQRSLKMQLKTAPKSLKRGFFSAETKFGFYDLQDAIATGTYYSIGLSLGMAFVVMLVTSRNLLICFYAILTITLAIASTVASIVLLGWKLNIIESITVSLAVGLSIDFTIHYGVAYRLSSEYHSKSRVNEAFRRVGGAVGMAALTTFVAGASVMPSRVLPYIKLGTFLMLCMVFSWTYATFFFQSLCRIIGPRGNFCQFGANCRTKPRASYVITDRTSMSSFESFDSSLVTV